MFLPCLRGTFSHVDCILCTRTWSKPLGMGGGEEREGRRREGKHKYLADGILDYMLPLLPQQQHTTHLNMKIIAL